MRWARGGRDAALPCRVLFLRATRARAAGTGPRAVRSAVLRASLGIAYSTIDFSACEKKYTVGVVS